MLTINYLGTMDISTAIHPIAVETFDLKAKISISWKHQGVTTIGRVHLLGILLESSCVLFSHALSVSVIVCVQTLVIVFFIFLY